MSGQESVDLDDLDAEAVDLRDLACNAVEVAGQGESSNQASHPVRCPYDSGRTDPVHPEACWDRDDIGGIAGVAWAADRTSDVDGAVDAVGASGDGQGDGGHHPCC